MGGLYGVITEVDQAPITVSVGTDNRLAQLFHLTLTDDEASIQITAWDRVPEFANFRLGEKVMVTGITVKSEPRTRTATMDCCSASPFLGCLSE